MGTRNVLSCQESRRVNHSQMPRSGLQHKPPRSNCARSLWCRSISFSGLLCTAWHGMAWLLNVGKVAETEDPASSWQRWAFQLSGQAGHGENFGNWGNTGNDGGSEWNTPCNLPRMVSGCCLGRRLGVFQKWTVSWMNRARIHEFGSLRDSPS
jgi:hypothetical protein